MDFSRGEFVYKYKLLDRIGGGNFGAVWKAEDASIDSVIAIKILDKDQYSIDERLLEAKIGNRLQHANVVNIKYADVIMKDDKNVVVVAMPWYRNGSIVNHVNSHNFIDLNIGIKCIIDILRGLEYLHENGYFHCDIKPNNILIGENNEAILSDYGITRYSPSFEAVEPRETYLPHIAPETIENNNYDIRSDIYQLGLTAFRLLNGIGLIKDKFFKNKNQFRDDVLAGKLITDSCYQPFIPRQVKRIITKAVNFNPDERYQTSLEMRRDLEKLHFPGYCTADESGNLVGIDSNSIFRFEIQAVNDKKVNLLAFKKNKKSYVETRFSKYCLKNLTQKELNKAIQSFLSGVVIGNK